MEGQAAADDFLLHTAPDLVVEVEITSADGGKIERYGQMGVRELWRLRGRRDSREIDADFLALAPDGPPRVLAASEVLDGLTPADVCEAVEPVRRSRNRTERTESVARIVRRRRQTTARVREQDPPPYAASAPRRRAHPPPTEGGAGLASSVSLHSRGGRALRMVRRSGPEVHGRSSAALRS